MRLLDEIRQVVGFDFYAWLLTDPETGVGSTPLAHTPNLADLPQLIRLKYGTEVNRWSRLADPPVALLQEATRGDPAQSLLWRELLSGYDIGDVASVAFSDRFGCWSFLDLWRAGAASRFSAEETAFLVAITPAVTRALRQAQADTFVGTASRDARRAGPVVLLLSGKLEVLAQTPDTQEYLRLIVPPPEGHHPIPSSAYNVAAQLLALEAGVDQNPAWGRLHLSGGLWVTASAARIGDRMPLGERDIAVTIEETSPIDRVAVFARAFGLAAREVELLGHLVAGCDTRELARRMNLSEHTVQDYLKSVFAKTSTNSRRTLLLRALGN